MNKTLFRTIAKQVHPDMSSFSKHTSAERMRQVIKYKDNIDMLIKIAGQWNLDVDINKLNSKHENFKKEVFDTIVGALIKHTFVYRKKSLTIDGVIINIRLIKKGNFKNYIEYKIFDLKTKIIYIFKYNEKNPFSEVLGMADNNLMDHCLLLLNRNKNIKKQNKKRRQDNADQMFSRFNLLKNTNYKNHIIIIHFRQDGLIRKRKLLRTTNKYLFFSTNNHISRVHIKNVLKTHNG